MDRERSGALDNEGHHRGTPEAAIATARKSSPARIGSYPKLVLTNLPQSQPLPSCEFAKPDKHPFPTFRN